MGGVVVLHPQDSFNNHHDNLYSTHQTIKMVPTHMKHNHPSPTPNFTVSDRRRQTPPKKIVRKKGRTTEVVASEKSVKTTEFFAGFAFVDSPPPSSVPLPGFFMKNFVEARNDDPTTGLRRILGLSLS
ncbi:uncharacterized protein LOC111895206 [Lactuca sativa]|uniref:Uncharacterized protein n=1 Tax=Lactuca sativa TaxID=4236 RepID=A0A9R1V666_LACSA|nr:uncharacterized protein LOC111895206 [Lactuca sativa]KAJ0200356.1 hypothetical protein LSAT_V11C600306390 [Lactuca sativa]